MRTQSSDGLSYQPAQIRRIIPLGIRDSVPRTSEDISPTARFWGSDAHRASDRCGVRYDTWNIILQRAGSWYEAVANVYISKSKCLVDDVPGVTHVKLPKAAVLRLKH